MPTLLSNAPTTLARTKVFLGIGSDTYDSLLTILINQATGFMERYTARKFLRQTYTNEVYDGLGTGTLILKQWPVASLSSLQERTTDEPDVSSWDTIDDKEYYWGSSGVIKKRAGSFLSCPQRYRATYAAGYLISFDNENNSALHDLPAELEYICHKLVSAIFNTRKAEGVSSSSIGDQSVTIQQKVFESDELKGLLGKYKKPIV